MYKNLHQKILDLPQGHVKPWVNLMWLLVLTPFLLLLGAFVVFALWHISLYLFKTIFG
jgi:hypothetical protein